MIIPAIVAGGGNLGDIVSDLSRRSIHKTDLDKNKHLTMNLNQCFFIEKH